MKQPIQKDLGPQFEQLGQINLAEPKPEPRSAYELKYGPDFKIPELPDILQQQILGIQAPTQNTAERDVQQSSQQPSHSYKIKKFIDEIYQKEMKFRYHKQYVREDLLLTKSPIFDL